MTHLEPETLARLVDEAPSAAEAEHLGACPDCAAEREAFAAQTRSLAGLGSLAPPAASWDALHTELCSSGVVRAPDERRAWLRPSLRAAAVVLLLGGAVAFALRGGDEPAPQIALRLPPAPGEQPAPLVRRTDGRASNPPVPTPARREAAEPRATERDATQPPRAAAAFASFAREGGGGSDPYVVAPDDAAALQALAGYIQAAAPDDDADPVEQLAAWEGIVLTTGAAVERSPADPVANGYHLLALHQRDAVLQQVAAGTEQSWF